MPPVKADFPDTNIPRIYENICKNNPNNPTYKNLDILGKKLFDMSYGLIEGFDSKPDNYSPYIQGIRPPDYQSIWLYICGSYYIELRISGNNIFYTYDERPNLYNKDESNINKKITSHDELISCIEYSLKLLYNILKNQGFSPRDLEEKLKQLNISVDDPPAE